MQLISEFFYDGIRRIIPGVLVLVLYFRKDATMVFDALTVFAKQNEHYAFIIFIALFLSAAWLVGFAVEQIMFAIVSKILWSLADKYKVPSSIRTKLGLNKSVDDEKKKQKDITDTEALRECRRFNALLFAEKAMSRSIWGIFFFACLIPPENIRSQPYHGVMWSAAGFLIFFGSWLLAVLLDLDLPVCEAETDDVELRVKPPGPKECASGGSEPSAQINTTPVPSSEGGACMKTAIERAESREVWKLRLEIVGVVAAIIYAYFTIQEWSVFDRERQTMETELTNAINTQHLDQRAWVFPDTVVSIHTPGTGNGNKFQVSFKNLGKTPALNMSMFIEWTTDFQRVLKYKGPEFGKGGAMPGPGGCWATRIG